MVGKTLSLKLLAKIELRCRQGKKAFVNFAKYITLQFIFLLNITCDSQNSLSFLSS
jgi:hypothetical protein